MAEKNPTIKELQATIDIMEESMIDTIEDVREELLDQIIDANDSYALLERDVDDLKQEVSYAYDRLDTQLKMISRVEDKADSYVSDLISFIALSLSIVSLITSIIALNG